MKKSIPKVRERESEASILGDDREREFPLTPVRNSIQNRETEILLSEIVLTPLLLSNMMFLFQFIKLINILTFQTHHQSLIFFGILILFPVTFDFNLSLEASFSLFIDFASFFGAIFLPERPLPFFKRIAFGRFKTFL